MRSPTAEREAQERLDHARTRSLAPSVVAPSAADADGAVADKPLFGPYLADHECTHGRLPGDRSEPCGCWPQERKRAIAVISPEKVEALRLSIPPSPFVDRLVAETDEEIERLRQELARVRKFRRHLLTTPTPPTSRKGT